MSLGEKENNTTSHKKLTSDRLSIEEIILKNGLSLLDPIEAKSIICIGKLFKDSFNHQLDRCAAYPKQKITHLKRSLNEAYESGLIACLSDNTSRPFLSYLWTRNTDEGGINQSYILTKTFGPNGLTGFFLLEMENVNASTNYSVLEHVQQITQTTFTKIVLHGEKFKKESRLTPREKDIIKWISHGKSNLEIAQLMGISIHTVNGYIRSIYLKTNTSDRVSLGFHAFQHGLLE